MTFVVADETADQLTLGAGEFLADVVKDAGGGEPRFTSTPRDVTRVIQPRLVCSESDLPMLLFALVLDGDEYFYTPDAETLWRNGLDGQRTLAGAFTLFEDLDSIKDYLRERNPKDSNEGVVYSLRRDGAQVFIEESVRLVRADPSGSSFS